MKTLKKDLPYPVTVLFLSVISLLGFYFSFLEFEMVYSLVSQGISAPSWIEVPGKVESTDVESHYVKNGEDYIPDIHYSFTVNGSTYHGDQLQDSLPQSYANESDAEAITAKYPTGSSVEVYYNPKNLEESSLGRPSHEYLRSLLLSLVALFTLWIGPWLLFEQAKKHRKLNP